MARKIIGSRGRITSKNRRSEILLPRLFPFDHAEPGGIVEYAPGANGHASNDAHGSVHAGETAIDISEMAPELLEYSDVSLLANGKSPEIRAVNFARGIDGGAADEVVESNAHGAEFGNDFIHVQDRVITGVQVCRQGIRDEALFYGRDRIAEPKAACAVTDVEDDATLARFHHDRVEFAVGKDDRELLGEDVSMNISRARFFEDEIGVGAVGAGPEIKHDRAVGARGTFNRAIDRSPRCVFAIPGSAGPVVGGLYTNNQVRVFLDGFGTELRVHLVDRLFHSTAHTVGHNIEESEDAHFGVIHHPFLFLEKSLGARSAGINDSGHPGLEGDIGRNAERPFVVT